MARPAKKREPQASRSFNAQSQRWHGYVSVRAPDGRMIQRHRSSTDYTTLGDKLLELEHLRDAQKVLPLGEIPTLADYLDTWIVDVAPLTAGYSTIRGTYQFAIQIVAPRRGGYRLDEVTTAMINALYAELLTEHYAPKSVGHVHRTLSAVFSSAVVDGFVGVNPISAATPPTVTPNSPRHFEDHEIDKLLPVIRRLPRNRIRWYLWLLGARQGEALAVRHERLNRSTGLLGIVGKLQRRTYTHGCGDPVACAAPYHRTTECPGRTWQHGCSDPVACAAPHCDRLVYPSEFTREGFGQRKKQCPPKCSGHARACPERVKGSCKRHKNCVPCSADCVGHAVKCPRRRGGLMLVEDRSSPDPDTENTSGRRKGRKRDRNKSLSTKTPAGTRYVAFPPFVMDEYDAHVQQQRRERVQAGSKWQENGLIVADKFGRPVDPRRDWDEYNAIIDEAGVEYREPHVGRKTAATVMLKLGMDRRIVMAHFGWESEAMLRTYQDVPDSLLIDAAQQIGSYYGSTTTTTTTTDGFDWGASAPSSSRHSN